MEKELYTNELIELNAEQEKIFGAFCADNPALQPLEEAVLGALNLLRDTYDEGGKVLICGNGGSAADAEHIVGELMKGFLLRRPLPHDLQKAVSQYTQDILPEAAQLLQQGLPALALSSHPALNSAVVNDLHPLLGPAQQVVACAKPEDVFLGISTSGNAKNVCLAAGTAKALGLAVIGLTGGSGGRLKPLCDCAIVAPANTPADVQELHLPIYHTLCAMLEARFFEE